MAIVQISQVQVRRGLNQDLPDLAGGELGWSQDTRQLYIGNGLLSEGAPVEGVTEILTEFSVVDFTSVVNSNIGNLSVNVSTLQGNVVALQNEINVLSIATNNSTELTLGASTSGLICGISANNAIITYTLTQGTEYRTGIIKMGFNAVGSTVNYDEEYTDPSSATDTILSMSANSTYASLNYSTTTATTFIYKIQNF